MTVRRIFIASTVCWNLAAVAVGIYVAVAGLSYESTQTIGWLSLGFAIDMAIQGYVIFHLLRISFLTRYIRFGFTTAAFSRANPKLMVLWLISGLAGLGLYIGLMTEMVSKSSSDPTVVRTGIVLYTLIGGLVASLVVGLFIVSRITPYISSLFVGSQQS